MNFKKILVALLASALLLSSCASDDDNTGSNKEIDNVGGTVTDIIDGVTDGIDDIAGDLAGEDGMSGGDDGMDEDYDNDNNKENEDTAASPVDKVESADDAAAFIDANVYSQCQDVLPMMTRTNVLSTDDMDTITYNTGLTDTSGITDVILSESGVGSIAYSLVYLRTDGTNTAEIQTALGNSINPSKWICVTAEYISSVTLDNDIILIMGSKEQVDTIMNAVTSAAEGVYENIGSVVTF